jgi:hypothetical protein
VQEIFDRAGTREVEEDTVLVLLDLGQRGMLQGMRAQSMMQDIGGTGQQKPHGVGQEGRRRGVVAVEITLDRLDIFFTIPMRAVDLLTGGKQSCFGLE